MRFASPLLLALLVVVPVLLALWLRDERRRTARLAMLVDAGLLSSLARGVSASRRAWRRGLLVAAFAFFVVAAAGPQVGDKIELLPSRGLDVLFVIDVSRSMRARDVLPDRLERAKAEIAAVLPRLADHRVGIVAFAGSAFVQCPLTTDLEAVRLFLTDLRPETIPQGGTALGAGLEVALNAIRADAEDRLGTSEWTAADDKPSAGRVLVVVSDGEDHEGNLEEVAGELKAEDATVVLIGVGSTLGEPIPLLDDEGGVAGYVRDRAGQTVMTRMSPEVLTEVASQVGGVFVDGTGQPDLGLREVEAKIAGLEKRDLESRTQKHFVDRTWIPLLAALLCALAALVVPERARGAGDASVTSRGQA